MNLPNKLTVSRFILTVAFLIVFFTAWRYHETVALVLFCIDHSASVYSSLCKAKYFIANILSDGQEALARRFADRDSNRFEGVGYDRGKNGAAVLFDVLCYIECEVVARHESGDHDVIVGRVEVAEAFDGRPLLYYRGGYAQLER